MLWQVSAHLLNSGMSRIRISPCGSGSDFYNMITDPLIRIRITGFALWLSCWRQSHHIGKYFQGLKKPIKSSKLKKALVFKTTKWLFFFFLWTYCLELLKTCYLSFLYRRYFVPMYTSVLIANCFECIRFRKCLFCLLVVICYSCS